MKKTFVNLAVALLLLLSVCSCGKTSEDSSEMADKEKSTLSTAFESIPTTQNYEGNRQTNTNDGSDTISDQPSGISGGEEGICQVHVQKSYHTIPYSLISKVGNDRFNEWIASLPDNYNENGCTAPCSLVIFVQDFNFTSEQIAEFAYGADYYGLYGDVKSLCSGDFDRFEESSKLINYDEDYAQRLSSEHNIKVRILNYLKDSGNIEWIDLYNSITKNGQFNYTHTWSIPEIVYKTGISQDVLEDAWHKIQYNEFLNCQVETFDYDFSLIYKNDFNKEIADLYPIQVDELLRK